MNWDERNDVSGIRFITEWKVEDTVTERSGSRWWKEGSLKAAVSSSRWASVPQWKEEHTVGLPLAPTVAGMVGIFSRPAENFFFSCKVLGFKRVLEPDMLVSVWNASS